MRPYFIVILFLTSALSGCFGSDLGAEEKKGIPGGLSLACLQDDGFQKMEIHFLYESGYNSIAMELVKTRLQEVCNKPGGIAIKVTEIDFAVKTSWSSDDVREARWKHGGDAMGENTLHWYFLFPAGMYEDDSVLGIAVDASTVAIFKDSVEEAEGFLGRPSSEEIERAVTIHEAGHLLGLVNLVYESPIVHEDPDNPGHSSNDNSVMYWAIESNDVGNFITGNLPDEFDEDDKSDLKGIADGTIDCRDQLWS
jgi:hypothetical protein